MSEKFFLGAVGRFFLGLRLYIIQILRTAYVGIIGRLRGGRGYWRGRVLGLHGSELGALDEQRRRVDFEQFCSAQNRGITEPVAFCGLAVCLSANAEGGGNRGRCGEFIGKQGEQCHSGFLSKMAGLWVLLRGQRAVDGCDDKVPGGRHVGC